jgi:rod shape-determining protein MreD
MSRSIDQPALPSPIAALLPAFTILAGALVLALPIPMVMGGLPMLPLLLLVAWSGVQPRLIPGWAAFLLGLLADALTGLPLGVLGASFVGVRVLGSLAGARAGGRGLIEEWLAGAALLMAAAAFQMAALALAGSAVAPQGILVQALLSILLYPAGFWIVARVNRRLADNPDLVA